jgi:CHAD domain-containing protein
MAKPSTKPPPKKASLPESVGQQSPTVAEVSYDLIRQQYDCMIQQEQGVLADQDPEYLHQMRVGSRRLRTALQVFGKVVKLPKAAKEKHVQALTKTLGKLRDLDVQIAATRENYYPHLNPAEQKRLDKLLVTLEKQRHQALAEVKTALTDPDYQKLKCLRRLVRPSSIHLDRASPSAPVAPRVTQSALGNLTAPSGLVDPG